MNQVKKAIFDFLNTPCTQYTFNITAILATVWTYVVSVTPTVSIEISAVTIIRITIRPSKYIFHLFWAQHIFKPFQCYSFHINNIIALLFLLNHFLLRSNNLLNKSSYTHRYDRQRLLNVIFFSTFSLPCYDF